MHYFIMCTLYILHTIFAALVAILNILCFLYPSNSVSICACLTEICCFVTAGR